MIRAIVVLFAALLTPRPAAKEPGLVLLCDGGWITAKPDESHIASGHLCVVHDRSGAAVSAGAVSVYNDERTVP